MTAKQYLQRVRDQRELLAAKRRELDQLRKDVLSLSAPSLGEAVQTSTHADLSNKVVRLEASMARVSAEWDKLITMQSEAEYLIAQVPNVRYQAILLDRYITGLSWTDIGKALHYNLYGNGVFKLHARALKSFQSVHKNTLEQVI